MSETIFEKSRPGRGTRYVDDRGWNTRCQEMLPASVRAAGHRRRCRK